MDTLHHCFFKLLLCGLAIFCLYIHKVMDTLFLLCTLLKSVLLQTDTHIFAGASFPEAGQNF